MNVSAESKVCPSCGCEKPTEEFYRNRTRKDGRAGFCIACMKVQVKASTTKKPDQYKAANKAYYEANKPRIIARDREWSRANAEKRDSYTKKWREANPEKLKESNALSRQKHKEARAAALKDWRRRNPGRVRAQLAGRKKHIVRATPKWANKEAIRQFYEIARKLTDRSSTEWHVDHIVPLRSDLVCGLHVHNNLRVIRGADNVRKSNLFDPDIPD